MGDYQTAQNMLKTLSAEKGVYTNFITLQQLIILTKTKPNLINEIINAKNIPDLLNWAESGDVLLEGDAKALLSIANISYTEECLVPEQTSARLAGNNIYQAETINQFNVFPNPNNGVFEVVLDDNFLPTTDNVTIQLINILGEFVQTTNINQQKTIININELNSGLYFVNLVRNNTLLQTKKVMVQK